jgi:hypothetical protein
MVYFDASIYHISGHFGSFGHLGQGGSASFLLWVWVFILAYMNNDPMSIDTKVATIGGTVLSIFENINPTDIDRTIVLGALGAVVSFVVSMGCRLISDRLISKFKNKHKDENDSE